LDKSGTLNQLTDFLGGGVGEGEAVEEPFWNGTRRAAYEAQSLPFVNSASAVTSKIWPALEQFHWCVAAAVVFLFAGNISSFQITDGTTADENKMQLDAMLVAQHFLVRLP
jgi:hypothetical protein